MRIAFTSCHFTRVFAQQPVWSWIAQQNPDHLVLLGDKFYLDVNAPMLPQQMTDFEFALHQRTLYAELVAQPEFAALAAAMPGRVHAIWDDHDFLWDNVNGADVRVVHGGKIDLSTAYLELFREALTLGFGAAGFPPDINDARVWVNGLALSTPSIELEPGLMLHLSDGRSFRTRTFALEEDKRTMFGAAQRARFDAEVRARPQAVHLLASGTPFGQWQRYAQDVDWLLGLAADHRLMVLSGDIHRNRLDGHFAGGFALHEATASGAAVRDAVVIGAQRRNYGLLDIDAASLTVRLFHDGHEEGRRSYDRQSWLPL